MMNAQIKAAQAAAQAELCPNLADTPVDLHEEYHRTAACGFDTDLNLRPHEARDLAARIRAIGAINAVFMATSGDANAKLSEWMAGGLQDAIRILVDDACSDLEEAANRCAEQRGRNEL